MNFRKRGFRAMVLGLLVAAGLALAPAAFARGHVDIGISLPGVSVGYWGGHHGYVGVGGYGYGGGYYGGYYAPAPIYYDNYYAPAYGVVYGGPAVRVGYPYHYYRGGYYYRDRGYSRRGYR
ncbi:MAG: hypothetical protein P4L92_01255 [Rudaea sp.]|nr:hypothetical protein [Rudaea sp.]